MNLKKPYLGFCLGCQLLGEVVGGKVIKSAKPEIGMLDVNFSKQKENDLLFSSFPNKIKALQWHSYEVTNLEQNKDITLLASSNSTKYQIFKYQNHAYGIQFHIEVKDTTVNDWGCVIALSLTSGLHTVWITDDWGCVIEYKTALEEQLGEGALEKFDKEAKSNMFEMNNCSEILYSNFKRIIK